MRAPALMLTLDAIWRSLEGPLRRRVVTVDEAWDLMRETPSATREAPGARFLFRLAKKARKRWTGLTTITQDPGDLLDSPLGQAVVNNATQHFLLRQSPQAIDRVGQAFALTAGERSYLLSCPVGHGLLLNRRAANPAQRQGERRRARACDERPGRARGGCLKRAALSSCGLLLVLPVLFIAAAVGVLGGGSGVSLGQPAADTQQVAGIPPEYLQLFQAAGARYGVPWTVLAGIGKVECDDGQDPDPACTQEGAVNYAGAGGPMQFLALHLGELRRQRNG